MEGSDDLNDYSKIKLNELNEETFKKFLEELKEIK